MSLHYLFYSSTSPFFRMETRLVECRKIQKKFLDRWPLDRVTDMTLTEYTDFGNPDTFCRWIEINTSALGSIKGHPAIKFGIYRRNPSKDAPDNYESDDKYCWYRKFGRDRHKAFKVIKIQIRNTIYYAQHGQFSKIDNIPLNIFVKWKIASLYSGEALVPIFTKDVLSQIAESYDETNVEQLEISEIQKLMMDRKPVDQNVYQFADEMYKRFRPNPKRSTGYYLLGSKYADTHSDDVYGSMKALNMVCVGFCWAHDLTHLVGKDQNAILSALKELGENPTSCHALKHFLSLQAGDIVAIRSSGNPRAGKAFLEIVAYAVVVEREGHVYWHDTENFGHCMNVEFIATDLHDRYKVGGYSGTIYRITDTQLIDKWFEGHEDPSSKTVRNKIKTRRRSRKPSLSKTTKAEHRKGSKPYVTNPRHNAIQQLFKEHLEEVYGADNVLLEENHVDIKLLQKDHVVFYEVKPYDLAEDCIRAGIGQSLAYVHFDEDRRRKKIRVVGPFPADNEEKKFIGFLQDKLRIDFDYEHFSIE